MRALIISIVTVAVMISGWSIFVNYSDKNIHQLMNSIEDDILISVYAEDWDKAEDQYNDLSEKWHKQKKIYTFFFNTKDINDTDYSIARAKNYIYAKDVPLASGELNCIQEQLKFLHLNELITIDNVF
ncbi:MAG TPA: DUF4363 family protein [Anaerovoracaceae bacterium]|nr:DUF4363 family protein [Anaerovoracaceae bacterium]